MNLNNKYYILRHGQALSNIKNIVSCWPEKFKNPLTKKGRKMVENSARDLKNKDIDLIFASPLLRTKQTAEIAGKELKIRPIYDERLTEYNFGILNGKKAALLIGKVGSHLERFNARPKNGENYTDIKKRMRGFLKELEKKYKRKNILIISHQATIIMLMGAVEGLSPKKIFEKYFNSDKFKTAEVKELNYSKIRLI